MIKYFNKTGNLLNISADHKDSLWIHISPPFNQKELEKLSDDLFIPLDFLTDSLDIDERSRYEKEDDIRLIVVNTPVLNAEADKTDPLYITIPIGIILTADQIITITAFENPVVEKFLQNRVKSFNPVDKNKFVLQILEQNVFSFLSYLKKLNTQRNKIEKQVYNSSSNKGLQQLLGIEKSLVYFVTALSSNELLKLKMKRTDFLSIGNEEELTDLFEDIIIDNSQALEMANVHTNILRGTMDALASIISNNLNIVMKRLTLITIILMVPTLVASFFGMNLKSGFEDVDGLFYIVIVSSIVISLVLAFVFRQKRLF